MAAAVRAMFPVFWESQFHQNQIEHQTTPFKAKAILIHIHEKFNIKTVKILIFLLISVKIVASSG